MPNLPPEDEVLLQVLRRLSLEAEFDATSLLQLCRDLESAAAANFDEKSQISARLAGKMAGLIEANFIKSNGSPRRNGGSKSSGCGG